MMDKSLFKIKGFKKIMGFLLVVSLFQGAATIFQAKYLAITITNLFNGEKLVEQQLPLFFFCLFFLGRQGIVFIKERKMTSFSVQSGMALRQNLIGKIFRIGPNITQTEGTGNIVTMALEGVSQVETYIKLFLPKVINLVLIPMMIFLYTLTIDVRSGIILILVLPTLFFFMVILGMAAKQKANKQYASYQTLSNHFVDSLRGLETLRFLGLSKRYENNIRQVSERYRQSTLGTLKFAFLSTFALDFFTSLSVAIIALFLGLALIGGEMMLLPALTVLILAPEYFLPIREFGTDYHATLDGKNALQAIQAIIELPEQATFKEGNVAGWNNVSKFDLSNITVQHEGSQKESLHVQHFSWEGFGKIGIVGASGSGKSTFINMMAGLIQPNQASITLNQQSIPHFGVQGWQEQMLYIPQHPYIFNDTVANNIAFYTPHASREVIETACEQAGLTELVQSLPNGLDEIIGETGRLLSGGQEQRIALARALLDEKRNIFLFDEPTAHLDIETEWELKQSMLPLMENKLVFFASHRLHWMLEMDYILVLEHGRIVESGTHEELVSKKGHYYSFMQAQMNEEEANG